MKVVSREVESCEVGKGSLFIWQVDYWTKQPTVWNADSMITRDRLTGLKDGLTFFISFDSVIIAGSCHASHSESYSWRVNSLPDPMAR